MVDYLEVMKKRANVAEGDEAVSNVDLSHQLCDLERDIQNLKGQIAQLEETIAAKKQEWLLRRYLL